jgi:hypothetical protein
LSASIARRNFLCPWRFLGVIVFPISGMNERTKRWI